MDSTSMIFAKNKSMIFNGVLHVLHHQTILIAIWFV